MIVQMKKGPIPENYGEVKTSITVPGRFRRKPKGCLGIEVRTGFRRIFDDGDYFTCPVSKLNPGVSLKQESRESGE